jgi:hypothetical protein
VRRRRKARLAAADLGRSRGRLTTKTHLSCVPQCLPLSLKITAGQAGDSPQFIPVLNKIRVPGSVGRPRTRPDARAPAFAWIAPTWGWLIMLACPGNR